MNNRPKSNYAQIVTAIVAILALLFGQNICSRFDDDQKESDRNTISGLNESTNRVGISEEDFNNKWVDKKNSARPEQDMDNKNQMEENIYGRIHSFQRAKKYHAAMIFIDSTIAGLSGQKILKQRLLRTKSEIELQKELGCDWISWDEDTEVYLFEKYSKMGIVSQRKIVTVKAVYDEILPVNNNLFAVLREGNFGFIDSTGRVFLDYVFDDVFDLFLPFVVVMRNKKVGLVDPRGKLVIPATYDDLELEGKNVILRNESKYALADTLGNKLLDFKYSLIIRNDAGEIIVYDENNEYFWDEKSSRLVKK